MKKIFTFAAAVLASLSMMAANGAYSNMTVSGDTTKWDFGAATTGSSVKITSGTIDNGILFINASNSNQQLASSGGLSNKAESELYFPVSSATATGTISMTTYSASDSRWLQLFVGTENAGESKRLWSKFADPATAARGPQSFEFTSVDLTEHEGTYYLKFASNNTEMKIATITIIEETGVRYTVTYMDGETVLGTEKVKEGENATNASTYEAKAHATFDGWFEDAACTTPATFTGISADKTVYGKWTADAFTASTSINIEQLVLDNGKSYDIAGALTAAHIAYANIDALDSLNSSKDANNEPYLGLKLKKKDAYLEVALNNGDALKVKFGAVAAAFKVNVDGVESSMETSTANTVYELTATKDEYVRFTIVTDNKTVVFKQIMINQDIQEIDQPAVVNDATLATLTLDGVAIEGFAAGKKEYTVTLAAGTTLPVVAATANDANATVGEIAQATTLPGDATFTVTAADGTTTANYTIHFVLPREMEYLTAPYETSIPADFELPNWLAGCTVNLNYTGSDAAVAGNDVIRLEKTDTISMYIENVDSVIVDLSATGDRTVAIAVDGEEKANSGKFGKNTLKTLGAYIHSEGQVIVNIYGVNVGGGTTISRIKLTEYGSATPTGLNNLEAVKAVKVIENGQIVIIKNGVRYNAVGAKL